MSLALSINSRTSRKQRSDLRTRRERLRALHHNWEQQMDTLVDAYLQWRHPSIAANLSRDATAHETSTRPFHVTAIFTNIPQRPGEFANISLLRLGLLGCTPVIPSVAISLETLELYHRLRRRHAQLGIQPMVRALCDVHNVNYRNVLREQFSSAFDIYLNILRRVQKRMNAALKHDTPDWRMKHACPCCNLKLEGEPVLHPERLIAIDGNNSAKRVASAGAEDERCFDSDYFLSRDEVDRFQHEVKRKPTAKISTEDNHDISGDAPDGQERPSPCTERWKASAAEHEKCALDIYESTGIFVCACRHGFIQKACEMIRSGELTKYPLAVVNHILDVHQHNCGCGYDIGCAFAETAKNSKLLGPKVAEYGMQFVVCAFHGYAHNQLCQLVNHPLYLSGYSIEDLEGMERVFAASNTVARGIRYASRFHYTQSLDLHFQQWDEDKYTELSRFLYNNYRQCLQIVEDFSVDVSHLKNSLKIDDTAFEAWLSDERHFLKNLKDEPEERVLECAYVQALIDRERADEKLGSARIAFVSAPSHQAVDVRQDIQITRCLENARRAAQEQAATAYQAVGDLEIKLAVEERWMPEHPKYQETLKFMRNRDFHRALEKVQQLVIQRLLEMLKANMTGLGYKMRTSIWKALKTCGKAIHSALKKYNTLARQMDPPAPTLEWKDVLNYTFVSEFDLLRHSHSSSTSEVGTRPWAVPFNREIAAKYWKIRGAYDELKRLHIEIPRLRTHIQVEFKHAIEICCEMDPLLAAELQAHYQRLKRVNAVHLRRLNVLTHLRGFHGSIAASRPTDEVLAQLLNAAAPLTAIDGSTAIDGPESTLLPNSSDVQDTEDSDDDTSVVDGGDNADIMVRFTNFLEDMVASS
ncbi:hypothetical protein OBBRIDRAFT_734191 [Obba rivulosa]|uniref:CxC1-like cysteine cluster associated with KDZ transposases domain-containing protein n=1 Tax=Obba rivulosa TaxID=1052685 RepID=A0A8E2AQ27_9APHY|nr:hypothetical protein OBBRIDRAFT_734191 [Obba rivulosa]